MQFSSKEVLKLILLSCILTFMLTAALTDLIVSNSFHKDAVTKGYAHWEPNPSDGQNVFTWNK